MDWRAVGAVVVLAFAVVGVSSVSAASVPVWGAASELTLPSNAASSNPFASIGGVSCTSAGKCVAGGSYEDTSGALQAMVATETGGSWGRASELTLPANAASSDPFASIRGVSCTSAGNCVAGGSYEDASGRGQAMVASETGGSWGRASEVTLPANAGPSGNPNGSIDDVSCTSAGNCVAGGEYQEPSGALQAMVATETDGRWGRATELTLPVNASTTGIQGTGIEGAGCTSAGNCVAGGSYEDTSDNEQAMVATERHGRWGRASELTLPANATLTSSGQNTAIEGVSCTSAGNCVAGGSYEDTSDSEQAMVATERHGRWGPASELTLPTNATATSSGQNTAIEGVSCSSAGNCVAGGTYGATSGTDLPMVATETGGSWTRASELTLPANADIPNDEFAKIEGVSCTGAGNCAMGGFYGDSSGAVQAMVASSVGSIDVSGAPSARTIMARYGNQRIALTIPSGCVALSSGLAVGFASTKRHHSPELTFTRVAFYLDNGVKRKVWELVRGKRKLVTVYLPNASSRRQPVSLKLSLAKLDAGTNTLELVVRFTKAVRTGAHKSTVTVIKTLRVRISVC